LEAHVREHPHLGGDDVALLAHRRADAREGAGRQGESLPDGAPSLPLTLRIGL
jgi:hypothetical protein